MGWFDIRNNVEVETEKVMIFRSSSCVLTHVCVCVLQVSTKTVSQCVEFYYLSKKHLDKLRKQKEEETRDGELEQQKSVRSS